LRGAAAGEGNHGRAAGHRLNRHNAEIFFAREKQRPSSTEMIANHRSRLPAEKMDVRPSQTSKSLLILAASDNYQFPAQPVAGCDRHIDTIVRSKSGHDEVIVLTLAIVRRIELGVHRRVDHLAGSAVAFADALLHRPTDGDKV